MCAASVAFTEMLGLDSTSLRVDVQAASRVLAHATLEDLLGDDTKEDTTVEDAIGSYILCLFMNHISSFYLRSSVEGTYWRQDRLFTSFNAGKTKTEASHQQ